MRANAYPVVIGIAGATLALLLLGVVVSGFHLLLPPWRSVLSALFTASVLAYAVWAAGGGRVPAWRLGTSVFLLYFGVSYVNTMNEAVFYLGLPKSALVGGLVIGLLNSGVVAGVLTWLMGSRASDESECAPSPPDRSLGGWLWRLAVGDLAYIILYFVAGLLVFPFVKDFYSSRPLPKPSSVVLMQVFRGMVYMGVSLPIAGLIRNRRHAALALGLAFSVLGGVAPLLPDNPLMPSHIRLPHTVEVGISNFIYGAILAYLFAPRSGPESRMSAEPAA